jgi:hypothetical protein
LAREVQRAINGVYRNALEMRYGCKQETMCDGESRVLAESVNELTSRDILNARAGIMAGEVPINLYASSIVLRHEQLEAALWDDHRLPGPLAERQERAMQISLYLSCIFIPACKSCNRFDLIEKMTSQFMYRMKGPKFHRVKLVGNQFHGANPISRYAVLSLPLAAIVAPTMP